MREKKRILSFIFGFICAVMILKLDNIFAIGEKIYVYLCDNYKIELDGVELKSSDGFRILNYCDYSYVPVRFISESLGAEVKWDDKNKIIKIKKPKAEVIEKIIEKKIEVPVESKIIYQKVPIKLNKKDFKLEINGVEIKNNLLYIYLDAKNDSGESLILDYENAKIICGEKKYLASNLSWRDWENAIEEEKLEDKALIFEQANNLDEKEMTLQIPVKSVNGSSYDETFEFNIKLD